LSRATPPALRQRWSSVLSKSRLTTDTPAEQEAAPAALTA
jgi:hypothetical protein